jgi:tRNA wybutosine-synthesizing protein 4
MSQISRYVMRRLYIVGDIMSLTCLKKPIIKFTTLSVGDSFSRQLLARFGASCLQHGDEFIVLGGVGRDHLLNQQYEVVVLSTSEGVLSVTGRRFVVSGPEGSELAPRPLFVGHSAVSMPDSSVVIVGGGATCFSMGTFWNKGVYSLHLANVDDLPMGRSLDSHWAHETTIDMIPGEPSLPTDPGHEDGLASCRITPIARLKVETEDEFRKIVREGRPVVLEGLDLGNCVSAWTLEYLVEKVGGDRKVINPTASTRLACVC